MFLALLRFFSYLAFWIYYVLFFFFIVIYLSFFFFFFSSRRRHTRSLCDWSSDVCSSDLQINHDRSERDGVYADPVGGVLDRRRAGQSDQSRLGEAVKRHVRLAGKPGG